MTKNIPKDKNCIKCPNFGVGLFEEPCKSCKDFRMDKGNKSKPKKTRSK